MSNTQIVKDGLVTVLDAAKFLSSSRSTLYNIMEAGELQYVKIGKSRRIPKNALLELARVNITGGWKIAQSLAG